MKTREELKAEIKEIAKKDIEYYIDEMFEKDKSKKKMLILEVETLDGVKKTLKNSSSEYSLPFLMEEIILLLNNKSKKDDFLLGYGIKSKRDILKSIKIIFDNEA